MTETTNTHDDTAMQIISDGAAASFLLGANTIDTLGEYVALVLGDAADEFNTVAIEAELRQAIEAQLPSDVVLAGAFLYAPYSSTHDWDAIRDQLAEIDFWAIAARHESDQ